MKERIRAVVIGGGQAGLAMSYHLSQRGIEHVVLERSRIAERWRTERWDSLAFQFPNRWIGLPGCAYSGNDPDGFSNKDFVAQFIEDYAKLIQAPVRCGINVTSVSRDEPSGRLLVEYDGGSYECDHVVLATGPYQKPKIPQIADEIPPEIDQVHASAHHRPSQFKNGAVMVVGCGSSGCQIAQELNESGITTYLCVGVHRRIPRRYRGRDLTDWLTMLGRFDMPIDELPGRKPPTPLVLTGVSGGQDMDVRRLGENGVKLLPRLAGVADGIAHFSGDVEERLRHADDAATEYADTVDSFIEQSGDEIGSKSVRDLEMCSFSPSAVDRLDLAAAGVRTILWCTGYSLDFDWVQLPILDEQGVPCQRRGVSPCDGVYFLGLNWMSKYKSSTLWGMGEDAEYIGNHMASRVRGVSSLERER